MLLAAGRMVSRYICHSALSSKQIAGLTMNIQRFCRIFGLALSVSFKEETSNVHLNTKIPRGEKKKEKKKENST